jgi:hypothetical protein
MADENGNWKDDLSEDVKGSKALKDFDGVESLAKSHIELVDKSGKPWVESLSDETRTEDNLKSLKDKSIEDVTKDYLRLKSETAVVPEKPEDYKISLPEGVKKENPFTQAFRNWAHEAKLSNDQVNTINASLDGYMMEEIKAQREAQEGLKQKAVDALKDEWKTDYDEKKKTALAAFAKLVPDEKEREPFAEFGNNPAVIKLFYKIGTMISEDKFVLGVTSAHETKSAAQVLYPEQK